ncbi:right-handed parallel beta-helix repeat-containing protein [Konateibacter massiliensis]|uniref:right-handed parallel beta-helix repeat-containing protein n=1 Tax=Konateibacter massiliensis TaxID=2002841 RepID=UPI000C14AAFB|nr:right-handed parallel beta-helix repeat-containing protein [Konateibacter massiliensis]
MNGSIKKVLQTVLSMSMVLTLAANANVYNVQAAQESLSSKGMYTNLYNVEDSSFDDAIYVSADGTSNGAGTSSSPLDLASAIAQAASKDNATILLKSGTYKFTSQITIDKSNSGKSSSYKVLKACKGATVKLDFSGESYNSSDTSKNERGIQLNGDYWYIAGITIYGAADNGIMVSGSHNVIERCIFDSNRDSGLQISRSSSSVTNYSDWPSYNYIINSTAKNNCDPATYENADGFASKLTCGDGNVFDGCISYNNSDDGWDLYAKTDTGAIGVVTIQNCIAMRNGMTEDGTTKDSCDGNGFKLGGSGVGTPHVVTNCIAIQNLHHGFTDNNNPSALQITNCTAFDNNTGGSKNNFSLYRCLNAYVANCVSYTTSSTSDKFVNLSAKYLVYYNSSKWYKVTDLQVMDTSSSATRGTVLSTGITSSDFTSTSVPAVGTDFDTLWRNSDGTLNTKGVAMIASSSSYAAFSSDGGTIGSRFSASNSPTLLTVPHTNTGSGGESGGSTGDPSDSTSYVQNFTESGLESDFFTITGNLSTSKGTVTYNGLTLTTALKIETSTNISFTTSKEAALTLVFNEDCNKKIKIDGTSYSISNGILETTLSAGAHTIAKEDSINLYYISVVNK